MAQIIENTETVTPSDKARMCVALALREALDYGWITDTALGDIQELAETFNEALSEGKTVVCQDVAYTLGDEPWPQYSYTGETKVFTEPFNQETISNDD